MAVVSVAGEVKVEDQVVGQILGLKFELDKEQTKTHEEILKTDLKFEVSAEIKRRVDKIIDQNTPQLSLNESGEICWLIHPIAYMQAGDTILNPNVLIIANPYIETATEIRLVEFISVWLKAEVEKHLDHLFKLSDPDNISGLAGGVATQLVENYGILVRDKVNNDIKALDQDARKQLRQFGVRFGAYHVFIPQLLKPAPTRLLMLLAALQTAKQNNTNLILPPHPGQGLTSVVLEENMPDNYYQTAGFRKCVNRAVRIDMLERLADLIREVLYWKAPKDNQDAERPLGAHTSGGFMVTPDMMSLVGCSGDDFSNILTTIGYRKKEIKIDDDQLKEAKEGEEVITHEQVWFPARKQYVNNKPTAKYKKPTKAKFVKDNKPKPKPKPKKAPEVAPKNSPFAALLALKEKYDA